MSTETTIAIALSQDDIERLKSGWLPCTRIRLIGDPAENTGQLEIDTRLLCSSCKGAGVWRSENLKASCKFCGGTGLR